MGEWAENTVISHFSKHPETGIVAVPYGERWGGKKRAETDAVNRPDLLLISTESVDSLAKANIDVLKLPIIDLPDSDPQLKRVVAKSIVAIDTKISFRYYAKKHVNFIIDEVRRKRYKTWLSQTETIGEIVVWFTLDKMWIAPMDEVLRKGKTIVRTYEAFGKEARRKKTWNMPVEDAILLADVAGVQLNQTLRSSMSRGPTGAVAFSVDDDLGILENLNLDVLLDMAKQVRRPSGK